MESDTCTCRVPVGSVWVKGNSSWQQDTINRSASVQQAAANNSPSHHQASTQQSSNRTSFQARQDYSNYNTNPPAAQGGPHTMSTSLTFDRYGVPHHHKLVPHTLEPDNPLHITIRPYVVSLNFGKYNIFPQTWKNHVVCHGEICSAI